jgi:hypothetical protein
MGICGLIGFNRLARCLRSEFDVISLFAAGTFAIIVVAAMCSGVILASVLER